MVILAVGNRLNWSFAGGPKWAQIRCGFLDNFTKWMEVEPLNLLGYILEF